MTNLTNINDVRQLQSNLRASLGTEQGKAVIAFLEDLCGWYDFKDTDPNQILIHHGGRRILATIKTLLEHSPEQVVAIAEEI